jgi:hypothetical protein
MQPSSAISAELNHVSFLVLLHLTPTYIRPYDLYPALASYRLMLVFALYILIARAIALAEVARRAKKPLPSVQLPILTRRLGGWCAATIALPYLSIKFTVG